MKKLHDFGQRRRQNMFALISWILFGIVVGAIARLLTPGPQRLGLLLTCGLGVIGSIIGGGITWLIQGAPSGAFSPAGWIMSIIGAVIVLLLFNMSRKRRGI
jgi:uncharacterized membrane protein YeaQ/YmgE (transglycosylase-associated protein family)